MLKKVSKIIIVCVVILLLAILIFRISGLYKKVFYPIKFDNYVSKYSEEYDVDKYFVYSVIKTESNFDENAVSNVGARGLMQLMDETFDWVKFRMKDDRDVTYDEMFNPQYNIEYGTCMLKLLLDEYQDKKTALAAYHAGRSTVNTWIKNSEYSKDGKTLDVIPSKTTAHYVNKVINAYDGYTNLYNN